jgi:hypothetical protein
MTFNLNSSIANKSSSNSIDFTANIISYGFLIVFLMSFVLNVITIASILLMKNFKPINVLIMNLALADLIYTAGIPFLVIQIINVNFDTGLIGCRFFFLSDFIGMIVGAFTVVALCMERFFTVADTKKRTENMSNKFKMFITLIYLLFVWLVAIFFSLPFIDSLEHDFPNNITCNTNWSDFSLNIFFAIKFIFIFLLPYTLISISSIKLLSFLNKWRRRIDKQKKKTRNLLNKMDRNSKLLNDESFVPDHSSNDKKKSKSFKKNSYNASKSNLHSKIQRKSSRTVLLIVLLFFIQWMPLWIVQLVLALNYEQSYLKILVLITTFLSYSNSISNPLLYMLMTYEFKKFFRKLFKC